MILNHFFKFLINILESKILLRLTMFTDGDASIAKYLIEWIRNDPKGTLFVFICFILWAWKDIIKSIPSFIWKMFTKSKIKVKYTFKDLKNHPVFSSLSFWLEQGLEGISYSNTTVLMSISHHVDIDDYLKAKEEMAKEVLKIKISTMNDMINKLVIQYDWNSMSSYNIIYAIKDNMKNLEPLQYKMMHDAGLPKIFVQKFKLYDMAMQHIFEKMLMTFVQEDMMQDIDGITRAYLGFNAINAYLCTLFDSSFTTILNINGDLIGQTWKGKILEPALINNREAALPELPDYPEK